MAYINLNDVVLHYESYGSGTPIILLHGNGENMYYFHNQIPVLSAEYRVIAIDTRGHGASTRGCEELTFETFCEDLYKFMVTLNIAKAHILGFSDGANIALYFALAHPEKIAGLILNSPNLNPQGLLPILLKQMKAKYAVLKLIPFSKKVKREIELLELMIHQPTLSEELIANIEINTLLIVGEKDMISSSHFKRIAYSMPHCVLKVIPNGTHFVAQKQPEIFNQEIMRFLARFSTDRRKKHNL